MPEAAHARPAARTSPQFLKQRGAPERAVRPGASDGIEVAMGGGRRHFLPRGAGRARGDGRDLIAEWQALYPPAATVPTDADDLAGEARTGAGAVQ
jgi:alkaline phosphatase